MVDLDEIFLRPRIRHRQVVLLRQRVLAGYRGSVDHSMAGWLGKIWFRGSHGSVGHGQRAVEREQGAADLGIRGRVDLVAFGAAEKVVNHIERALTFIASCVANLLLTAGCSVDMLLVKVESIIRRRLRSVIAAGLRIARDRASHLPIMVVIARGLWHLRSVVHTWWVILAGPGKDRVIGMSLDVLLQVLRSFE